MQFIQRLIAKQKKRFKTCEECVLWSLSYMMPKCVSEVFLYCNHNSDSISTAALLHVDYYAVVMQGKPKALIR